MRRLLPWRAQQGDTIVEVLIAIAVVSLVLTAAYAITNKNTIAIQTNQERVQAQHLVESQIEALRSNKGITITNSSIDNCFDGLNQASGASCTVQATGSGADYELNIVGPTGGVYTVSAKWTSIGGHTDNDSNVTMYYRVD